MDSDPLSFLGDAEEESNTPAPPLVIPKDAPDQHAPKPDLMPSSTLGLNLKTYFAQNIEDPSTRMQRMENVIVAMHKDMQSTQSTMQPATLMPVDTYANAPAQGQPTSLTNAAPTPPQVAQPAPTAPRQNYAKAATGKNVQPGSWLADKSSAGQALATGIRVGEHKNTVRVVFDVTKQTTFRADLDNNENILVVELPEAVWKAPQAAKFPKVALFDSYRVDPFNGNSGSIAVIQLKRGTSILKTMQIPALSGGGKRIYIDLAK